MNPFLYMLAGAAALAVAYGLYVGVRETIKAVRALTTALGKIPQLVGSLSRIEGVLDKFSGELEFVRNALTGSNPVQESENPQVQAAPRQRPPLPVFPGAPPFTPIPDAKVEDTDVIEQDDAELVQQELLEEIRGQGFEAEPAENPPGIVRSV